MRYFTVEEANEVVRQLRPILLPIVEALSRWDDLSEEERSAVREQAEWVLRAAENEGFIIRDFSLGLVDFPAVTRSGELVYLCWKVDEPEVMYFHGEEGFVGRRRIDMSLFPLGDT